MAPPLRWYVKMIIKVTSSVLYVGWEDVHIYYTIVHVKEGLFTMIEPTHHLILPRIEMCEANEAVWWGTM